MKRALKSPEVQFFLIIVSVLTAVFFINRAQLFEHPEFQYLNGIFFLVLFFISFLQMLYGLHVRSNNLKEEKYFLRMAAHQMRTPATAVSWMFDELKDKELSKEERDDIVKMGGIATTKFISVLDTFSRFSELDLGQPEYTFSKFSLSELVEGVVKESLPVAKQYGVSLTKDVQPEEIICLLDPVKFEIVVSNLVHNAIKYNHHNGAVHVSLRRLAGSDQAELVVRDTGIGISLSDQQHIFSLFFRSKEAKKLNPLGTGLGLYLVSNIVKRHKGTITVSSTPNKGTTFRVLLPLAK